MICFITRKLKQKSTKGNPKSDNTLFNYESITSSEDGKERIGSLEDMITIIVKKIKKSLDPTKQRRQMSKGKMISPEIVALAKIAKTVIKDKFHQHEAESLRLQEEGKIQKKDETDYNERTAEMKEKLNSLVLCNLLSFIFLFTNFIFYSVFMHF